MSWDNWGRYDSKKWDDNDKSTWVWNIDHIKPVSCFNSSFYQDEGFKICWSLNNLRPYSAKQNVLEGIFRTRYFA